MGQPTILAVLAGGHGQRLGGAKATALLAERPLISYPLAAARAAGLDAVVVVKPDTTLPPLDVQVLHEPQSPVHPLSGVLAALDHASALPSPAAVVVVACDMPFLTGPLLEWLASLEGAAMAEVDGRAQPLLARCEPEHRDELQAALARQSSLTAAMRSLEPRILDSSELGRFGPPERLVFNVNDRDELLLAEEWLA